MMFSFFIVWLSLKTLCSKVMALFASTTTFLFPDELSMDKRDSNDFFSMRRVCIVSGTCTKM